MLLADIIKKRCETRHAIKTYKDRLLGLKEILELEKGTLQARYTEFDIAVVESRIKSHEAQVMLFNSLVEDKE